MYHISRCSPCHRLSNQCIIFIWFPKTKKSKKGREKSEKRKKKERKGKEKKEKTRRTKMIDREVNEHDERGANAMLPASPPHFCSDRAPEFVWGPQAKKCTKLCELTSKITSFLCFWWGTSPSDTPCPHRFRSPCYTNSGSAARLPFKRKQGPQGQKFQTRQIDGDRAKFFNFA